MIAEISRGLMIAVATILIVFMLCCLTGCAADGSFDARAFDSVVRTGFDTYDRVRYPDRLPYSPRGETAVYPTGAPFPIYP